MSSPSPAFIAALRRGRPLRMALPAVLAVALALPAPPAMAETTSARFAVFLLGLKVAELTLAGAVDSRAYTVSADLSTTGLARALSGIRYLGKATGRRSGETFRPVSYSEETIQGDRREAGGLSYAGRVPRPVGRTLAERGPRGVPLAEQRDTVDPLTAMFMVLRDQEPGEVCTIRQAVFDGEKRTRVILTDAVRDGDSVVCSGRFERLAGYSQADMERGRVFAITVTYREAGGVMQAVRADLATIHGPMVVTRR